VRISFIKKRFSFHGGAEKYLQTLIEHLKRQGHDIHVYANRWSEERGVTLHKTTLLPLGSLLSALSFDHNVKKELKRNAPAGCIISFERTTSQDIYRAGDGCHKEWLILRKCIEPKWRQITFRLNPLHIGLLSLEKRLFQKTKLIVANSEMVKGQIIRHYALPQEKIRVIYNGVDLQRFSPRNRRLYREAVRKELSIPEQAKIILFVGSGFKRKGLLTLLRALAVLKNDAPSEDVRLIIIGKGNAKKFMFTSNECGLEDSVIFLGPRDHVEKFYAAADVFALPTIYDPFSNATIEAMASGLPVITTVNNGAAEIIDDGADGFLLKDMLDYNELSGKIGLAFSQSQRIGENARHKAEEYPIGKAVEEFTEIVTEFTK
jgi:UDP-glucose:(heptosyl)LPS alpha-1,3-glucosyltransferase